MSTRTKLRPLSWLLALAATALIANCGGDDSSGGDGKACTPGTTQSCISPGCAEQTVQICDPDGKAYGPCQCGSGSGGNAGASGTGGDAGSGNTGGADASAGSGGTAGTDAGASGTGGGAGSGGAGGSSGSGGAGGVAGCPQGKGPTMVDLGPFCIDSTEVTHAQYDVFAAEAKTKPPTQTGWCATNNPNFDKKFNGTGSLPVDVDWCDAKAFCEWAGKRMCGKIGGGSIAYPSPDTDDAKVSQHMYACTQGGTTKFPYGDQLNTLICLPGSKGIKPVMSDPWCRGTTAPFDKVFDLVGNQGEWVDACTFTPTYASCAALKFEYCPPGSVNPALWSGIRCCT